jgi:MoxR-like ATPase
LDLDLFEDPEDPRPDADRIADLTQRLETLDAQMHATAALAYFAFEQLERICLSAGLPSPAADTLARLRAHDASGDGLTAEMEARRERAMAMLVEQLQWVQRNAAER